MGSAKSLFSKAFDSLSTFKAKEAANLKLKSNIMKDVANNVDGAKEMSESFAASMKKMDVGDLSGMSPNQAKKIRKGARKGQRELDSLAFKRGESFDKIGAGLKEYYTGGTAGETAMRVAATGLAVGGIGAGASVGARLATGGSMTRTKNGNKDLAGVPFV